MVLLMVEATLAEHELFGAWVLVAGNVIAALVLAPALRQRMVWDGLG